MHKYSELCQFPNAKSETQFDLERGGYWKWTERTR